MPYVRGQERFVYEQVVHRVRDLMLDHLQWDGSLSADPDNPQYPWGATRGITWLEMVPDPKLGSVDPNTVAISEGPMPDDEELELGGGLNETTHTFFVDIYGESHSIAKSMAGDVRSILTGRGGVSRYFPLEDWASPGRPELAGHMLHFEDVEIEFPGVGSVAKLHWVVVKAVCVHEF
jgi:hypothetical protein